jgi:hypothetical protein
MQTLSHPAQQGKAGNSRVLTGTLPVRAFHPERFFGTLQVDGQLPRVAALVCHELDVVALSVVGYDTSVSAALAKLWQHEQVPFLLAEGVEWRGPLRLARRSEGYKQFSTRLQGTKEVQTIALPLSAHIAEGIVHPPDLPRPKEEEEEEGRASSATGKPRPTSPMQTVPVDRSRFVLGNWDEATPHARSFLGQLYAMRVIFLHRDAEHPEWADCWADELWRRGLTRKLIHPLHALGMKAWLLSGDLSAWGQLIGDGVRSGWLPWRAASPSLLLDGASNQGEPERELVLAR